MEKSNRILVYVDQPPLVQSVAKSDEPLAQIDQRAAQCAQLPFQGRAQLDQSSRQSDNPPPNLIATEKSSQPIVQSDQPPARRHSQFAQRSAQSDQLLDQADQHPVHSDQPPTQGRTQPDQSPPQCGQLPPDSGDRPLSANFERPPTQSYQPPARAPAASQAQCPPKKQKKMSASEVMASGREVSITSLDRKTPSVGDEATCALITWSNPKGAGRWRKPATVTRKEFAVIIGGCWDELHADTPNSAHLGGPEDAEDDGPSLQLAVFLESHKNGERHYHAVLQAPRTTVWHHLPVLLRDRRIACDVQIGVGAGVKHVDNMLRYCMTPTTDKFGVDASPFFSPGSQSLHSPLLPPRSHLSTVRTQAAAEKTKKGAEERHQKRRKKIEILNL